MDKYDETIVFAENIAARYGLDDRYVKDRYEKIKDSIADGILTELTSAKMDNFHFYDFMSDCISHGEVEQALLLYLLFDVLSGAVGSNKAEYNRDAFVYRLD